MLLKEVEEPDSRCLVSEWVDTTLWDTRNEPFDSKMLLGLASMVCLHSKTWEGLALIVMQVGIECFRPPGHAYTSHSS